MPRNHVIYVGPPIQQRQPRPGVPQDYVEFASLYFQKIRAQVAGFNGIPRDEVDDITQTIVMQFIEHDYLNIYNADKQSAHAEARYKAQMVKYEAGEMEYQPTRYEGKFSSFVYEFTKVRLMGIRDKANRRVSTMRSLDTFFEITENSDEGDDISLLVTIGAQDDGFQSIELHQKY